MNTIARRTLIAGLCTLTLAGVPAPAAAGTAAKIERATAFARKGAGAARKGVDTVKKGVDTVRKGVGAAKSAGKAVKSVLKKLF